MQFGPCLLSLQNYHFVPSDPQIHQIKCPIIDDRHHNGSTSKRQKLDLSSLQTNVKRWPHSDTKVRWSRQNPFQTCASILPLTGILVSPRTEHQSSPTPIPAKGFPPRESFELCMAAARDRLCWSASSLDTGSAATLILSFPRADATL